MPKVLHDYVDEAIVRLLIIYKSKEHVLAEALRNDQRRLNIAFTFGSVLAPLRARRIYRIAMIAILDGILLSL